MTAMIEEVEYPASFSFASGDVSLFACQYFGNSERCILNLRWRGDRKLKQLDSDHSEVNGLDDVILVVQSP